MRKRYHINPSNSSFNLNRGISSRSMRSSAKLMKRERSQKLVDSGKAEMESLVEYQNTYSEVIAPGMDFDFKGDTELKLEDEISENELTGFTFMCIESLAALALKSGRTIDQEITIAVSEKLPSFVKLVNEKYSVKRECVNATDGAEQFSVTKMMECVERTILDRYRSDLLTKRVDFLVEAVSRTVGIKGEELGLPAAVMTKVSRSISRVLAELS